MMELEDSMKILVMMRSRSLVWVRIVIVVIILLIVIEFMLFMKIFVLGVFYYRKLMRLVVKEVVMIVRLNGLWIL